MNKYIPILILTALLIHGGIHYTQAQGFSKNSLKIGFGLGTSMGNNTDGTGFLYSVGYQRDIVNDRLRLNPNLSFGIYSSKMILDASDMYFNSINIETKLFYDLVRIKSFALVLGAGGLANNSRGLRGSGGDYEGIQEPPDSEYISDFHFGGYLGGGFRIHFPDRRMSVNMMPVNLHFGNNYFAEFNATIELDFKF